jgi:hypothetical protein
VAVVHSSVINKSRKLKPPEARHNFSVWIFWGVGVLLLILAGLQYRWITQVSQAEQERQKENLRLAMNRLVRDFESEFVHPAFVTRRLERTGAEPPEGDSIETASTRAAQQYDEWLSSSRYPGLIKDIFITGNPAPGRLDIYRFDPQTRKLVPSDWPQELLRFRDFCIAESMPPTGMHEYRKIPRLWKIFRR